MTDLTKNEQRRTMPNIGSFESVFDLSSFTLSVSNVFVMRFYAFSCVFMHFRAFFIYFTIDVRLNMLLMR